MRRGKNWGKKTILHVKLKYISVFLNATKCPMRFKIRFF